MPQRRWRTRKIAALQHGKGIATAAAASCLERKFMFCWFFHIQNRGSWDENTFKSSPEALVRWKQRLKAYLAGEERASKFNHTQPPTAYHAPKPRASAAAAQPYQCAISICIRKQSFETSCYFSVHKLCVGWREVWWCYLGTTRAAALGNCVWLFPNNGATRSTSWSLIISQIEGWQRFAGFGSIYTW